MNYSISERIFTYTGPGSLRPSAVFAVGDLAEAECEMLKATVQRHLDAMNAIYGHGPFVFDVGPNANHDLAAFIILKTEWTQHERQLDLFRQLPPESWQWELLLVHDTAKEHAATIRSLRIHSTTDGVRSSNVTPAATRLPLESAATIESEPTAIRLQVQDEDAGGRFVMFDSSGAQEWGPRVEPGGSPHFDGTYTWTYDEFLYRLPTGHFVRVRHTSHCEANLPFPASIKRFSDAEAAEWLLFGGFDLPEDISHHADTHRFNVNAVSVKVSPPEQQLECASATVDDEVNGEQDRNPCDALQSTYRDPDNYWRNVWLYGLRKNGATNAEILSRLKNRASEFSLIDTENALRSALDAIADHHGWERLRGKPGRRRGDSNRTSAADS